MRIIQVAKKYESKIYLSEDPQIIFKLDCQCPDFRFRRIKKIGEFADVKYYATPCKHLKQAVEALERIGYKLKKPKELMGPDKLTKKLRKQLLERANYKCESPRCEATELLKIHRKTRGSNGGKYNMENCIVLCKECHDLRHANEFPSRKSN